MSGQPIGLFCRRHQIWAWLLFRVWIQTAFGITGIDNLDQKFLTSALVGGGGSHPDAPESLSPG